MRGVKNTPFDSGDTSQIGGLGVLTVPLTGSGFLWGLFLPCGTRACAGV